MNAHGVDVLHVTNGDDIASAVADDLILDFLPAGDAALDQHLAHAAEANAVGGDLVKILHGVGNTAASAAQGIGGTDDHRQTDFLGKCHGVLNAFHHFGSNAGLTNGLHGILKALTVLCLPDGLGAGAQQADAVLLQSSVLCQCHGQVQAGLTAQGGQDGVRALHFNDLGDGSRVQGLDIHMIGNVLIGHNGGRVGVYQHDLNALLPQTAAGLSAGIIKFRCLTDDNGAGAKDQYLLNAFILRHVSSPPSSQ